MTDIVFRLAAPLPLLNVQLRQHWANRAAVKKDLAWEVLAVLGRARPAAPIEFAQVTIWRHSIQAPDWDNLVASAKNLLDVLQPASERHPYGLGVIASDDQAHLKLAVHHVKAKTRTEQCTLVRIRPLDGPVAAVAQADCPLTPGGGAMLLSSGAAGLMVREEAA
ncbi:MAG TPA: hypothetical protein VFG62_08670 [Rhodopila sp.]|jgi:hypothetical protein|nr:hypothetical protein [Rhodopila sp.]